MRTAVKVPLHAVGVVPARHRTVVGAVVVVPVTTMRTVPAARPVTLSLKVAVAGAVSDDGVVTAVTVGAVVSPGGVVVPPPDGGVEDPPPDGGVEDPPPDGGVEDPPPACVAGALCTVNVTDGAAVVLPAASLVSTTSVWLPSLRPAGGVQGLLQATNGPPSTAHRKVTVGSELPNVTVGLGVAGSGAVTCAAAGGVVSTTQDQVSGLLTDDPSVVSTENECGPSLSAAPTV